MNSTMNSTTLDDTVSLAGDYEIGVFSENQYEEYGTDESLNTQAAWVACTVLLALACFCCCGSMFVGMMGTVHANNDEMPWVTKRTCRAGWYTAVVMSLLVATILVFLVYTTQLNDREGTTYHGLMYWKGFTLEEKIWYKSKGGYKMHSYVPTYQVEFGYDWACPSSSASDGGAQRYCRADMPTLQCQVDICRPGKEYRDGCWEEGCPKYYKNCSEASYENAKQQAIDCMLKHQEYNRTWSAYINSNTSMTLDPSVGPSSNSDWPSIMGFGNCDECSAQIFVASNDDLSSMRSVGFALLGITGVAAVLLGCLYAWQSRSDHDVDENDK